MEQTQLKPQKSQFKNGKRRGQTLREAKRYGAIYALMIPAFAFFIIFCYTPLYGLQLAWKDFKLKEGIWGSPWIGWYHFEILLGKKEFWQAFRNTLEISFLKLIFTFPVPIIIALAFNEIRNKRLMKTLQIIYTLPNFISWVILGGILTNLLKSSGMINNIIKALGGETVDFLMNGNIYRAILVISDIWKGAGWSSIIYMAAIAGVDPALYDSATVDGANRWQKMWHITLSGIRPTVATLLIMAVGGVMNGSFDQIYNTWNATVKSVAQTIDTYVYDITFMRTPNYGFSTAVGLFKSVINCIILLTANFVVGKLDENSKII